MGSRRGSRDLSERGVTVNVQHRNDNEREVSIPVGTGAEVYGTLRVPPVARGLVIFAHGSGSSRHSPRNRFVAEVLERDGLAGSTRTRTIAKATISPRVVNDFAALMTFDH